MYHMGFSLAYVVYEIWDTWFGHLIGTMHSYMDVINPYHWPVDQILVGYMV